MNKKPMKKPRKKVQKRRVYLDFAATTPIDPKVAAVLFKALKTYGNPSSLHAEGREAKAVLESSRKTVANMLNARAEEIIFTAGGTEANNLALKGIVGTSGVPTPHVVTSTIEHSSVLEVCRELEKKGTEVTYVKPQANGVIDPKDIRDALKENTVLVSVMYANNEIGTIQPIKEIAKVIRSFRQTLSSKHSALSFPYFHTDACQAANYLSLDTISLGVDLMTLDAGKIYGPKGVGALYIKKGTQIETQVFGGGQESGLRSGTENVALIAAFALALQITEKIKVGESGRLIKLRDYFEKNLLLLEGATRNGGGERLPNIISICFERLDAEFAVYQMDERGIALSSASTCMNNKEDSYSYVVEEIGKPECKSSSLRFSMGRTTTKKEIDVCLKALKEVLCNKWNPVRKSANETKG